MCNPIRMSTIFLGIVCAFDPVASVADELPTRDEVAAAIRKAATFYRTRVAAHGGYVYYYSVDLEKRWGEGEATADQIWVQPPGTPTVGMAYLRAYQATGEKFYLDAATDAAQALVYGQLKSGGWTNSIDFDPRGRGVALYRNGKGRGKNNSTLDDGISQAAIRLLIHVDREQAGRHKEIRRSAGIALDALLDAQFDNGAFPQVWTGPVPRLPVLKASYPDYDWRTEGRIKEYWTMYTLNDGVAGTVRQTLEDAYTIYREEKYKTAVTRLGDFLILAQMPDPQPAWAQQYNHRMRPIWARKFEPPAVTGWESQDVLEVLMKIYRFSGDEKYLRPIPPALDYLRRSLLPDGQLARYYELQTNRPLYMKRRGDVYILTHDDSDLPGHYGWKMPSRLNAIEREYRTLKNAGLGSPQRPSAKDLEREVRQILHDLDAEGRWISTYQGERLVGQPKFPPGARYISSAVFSRNVELLSEYLSNGQ